MIWRKKVKKLKKTTNCANAKLKGIDRTYHSKWKKIMT